VSPRRAALVALVIGSTACSAILGFKDGQLADADAGGDNTRTCNAQCPVGQRCPSPECGGNETCAQDHHCRTVCTPNSPTSTCPAGQQCVGDGNCAPGGPCAYICQGSGEGGPAPPPAPPGAVEVLATFSELPNGVTFVGNNVYFTRLVPGGVFRCDTAFLPCSPVKVTNSGYTAVPGTITRFGDSQVGLAWSSSAGVGLCADPVSGDRCNMTTSIHESGIPAFTKDGTGVAFVEKISSMQGRVFVRAAGDGETAFAAVPADGAVAIAATPELSGHFVVSIGPSHFGSLGFVSATQYSPTGLDATNDVPAIVSTGKKIVFAVHPTQFVTQLEGCAFPCLPVDGGAPSIQIYSTTNGVVTALVAVGESVYWATHRDGRYNVDYCITGTGDTGVCMPSDVHHALDAEAAGQVNAMAIDEAGKRIYAVVQQQGSAHQLVRIGLR
jgi:hypothetical protein